MLKLFFSFFPYLSLYPRSPLLSKCSCSFLHRLVSYRVLALSIARETLLLVAKGTLHSFLHLALRERTFFSNSFLRYSAALNGRVREERRARGEWTSSRDDVSRVSPSPPPINFPQFVLFVRPFVRNIIVTLLLANSRYSLRLERLSRAVTVSFHTLHNRYVYASLRDSISVNDIEPSN